MFLRGSLKRPANPTRPGMRAPAFGSEQLGVDGNGQDDLPEARAGQCAQLSGCVIAQRQDVAAGQELSFQASDDGPVHAGVQQSAHQRELLDAVVTVALPVGCHPSQVGAAGLANTGVAASTLPEPTTKASQLSITSRQWLVAA